MNVYGRVVPNATRSRNALVLATGVMTVFVFDFVLRNLRAHFVDGAGRIADLKLASQIFEQVMGIRMAARPASAGAFANNLREFEEACATSSPLPPWSSWSTCPSWSCSSPSCGGSAGRSPWCRRSRCRWCSGSGCSFGRP